ncbi:branched-chain amino acid ABC transporter permease [uncultured Ilyobacter sp.]|jgi:branched-chain amino acid transport system permease protein|uniref:branched-chain amino acid ABC transporter permease n=1 Tax=uncultured Ilyobacter sp. TaxID=544433 RepID=UPI0029BFF71D|nr:branched-chain amino acid ABC transporter permease [uncultured Ilyobacter sp.]
MKKLKNLKFILGIVAIAIYSVFFLLIQTGVLNPYYGQILIVLGINIILAVSLNLVIGFTGQLALGHAGFMSIGGYTAAIMSLNYNLPFFVSLVIGGLVSAVIGFLIGMPILRLKGDYLAITTLGFGEIIRVAVVNMDFLGGPRGLAGIPKKTNFTWVYFITLFTVIIIYNIIRSPYGRAMLSIREDEIASESMGINTTKFKMMAFVIASFFAGIAGGLYAHQFMFLDPKSFDFLKSFEILTFVVFGGMGSLSGSLMATTVLTYLPEVLRTFAEYRMIIYAASLVMLMLFRPQGIMGNKELNLKSVKEFILCKLFGKCKKGGAYNATTEG